VVIFGSKTFLVFGFLVSPAYFTVQANANDQGNDHD
jgi:hypothetical protein